MSSAVKEVNETRIVIDILCPDPVQRKPCTLSTIYLIKFFNVTLHYTRVSSSLMVLTGVSRVRLGPRPRRWNHDYTKASVSGSPFGSSPMSSSGSGSMRFGSYASHPWPISYILFCPSLLCLQSCFHALCLLFSRLR